MYIILYHNVRSQTPAPAAAAAAPAVVSAEGRDDDGVRFRNVVSLEHAIIFPCTRNQAAPTDP